MPFPSQTFATLDDWKIWIDLNVIPNGMELITGDDGNITENAAVKFIKRSPLNWEKAKIESSGGSISATRPVVVFMTTTPTLFSWPDNIYNEYIFINTTAGDIPLLAGTSYYDINLVAQSAISAKSIVNIVKASNDLWIVGSVPSSGSQVALPPLIGVVDRGNTGDPVSGVSTWQNDLLKNLGSTNNGEIDITVDNINMSNYGTNVAFDYDPILGIITLLNGNVWTPNSGVKVDRNQ